MPHENYSQNLCDVTGNTEEGFETIERRQSLNIDFENATHYARSRKKNQ